MSTLDSLALTRIPPADEALRAEVRAWLDEQLAITADAYARHTAGAAGIEAM